MSEGPPLLDRRASVRLPVRFPLALSDPYYRWPAEGMDLSPEGCGLAGGSLAFKPGKEILVTLLPAFGAGALELPGRVAHVTRGVIGVALDVSKTALLEAMLDRVDRLELARPELGVLAARAVRELPPDATLFPTGGAAVDDDERRFLRQLGAGKALAEVVRAFGAEWELIRHVPFSLLQRGALRAGRPGAAVAAAVPAANVRPPQAERYIESARTCLAGGDLRQAALNLRLARTLAPKDLEIAGMLEQVEAETRKRG